MRISKPLTLCFATLVLSVSFLANACSSDATKAGDTVVPDTTVSLWVQEAYLKAPNARTIYCLGESVALQGNRLVVGFVRETSNQTTITNGATASSDNSKENSGAVYAMIS